MDSLTTLPDPPPESHTSTVWPLIGLLLGVVGLFLGLILTLVFSTVADINHITGGHLPQQRGLLGLLAFLIGAVGVFFVLSRPRLAALLLVLASALLFFSFHLYGFIAVPFLLAGALLAATTRDPATPPPSV